MITFKKFINESVFYMLSDIKKDCSKFVNEIKHLTLYRGLFHKADEDNVMKYPHPTSRQAVDSTNHFNLMFNSMIDAAFNITDIRKKCFFASGEKKMANMYGTDVAEIFIIGEFKFIWSKKISDSYIIESLFWSSLQKEILVRLGINMQVELIFKSMGYEFSTSAWVNTNEFDEVIRESLRYRWKDESFRINKNAPYWTSPPSDEVIEKFPKVLKESLRIIGLEYYTDEDFFEAVERGYEILIYESDGYYASFYNALEEREDM